MVVAQQMHAQPPPIKSTATDVKNVKSVLERKTNSMKTKESTSTSKAALV